jgi:hypothetical protein
MMDYEKVRYNMRCKVCGIGRPREAFRRYYKEVSMRFVRNDNMVCDKCWKELGFENISWMLWKQEVNKDEGGEKNFSK